MSTLAVYAGTFDPITLGHQDVIERASAMFDELIVLVVDAPSHKRTMFTTDQRIKLVQTAVQDHANVSVRPFKGLLVDAARDLDANILVRGLRAVTDFEYEQAMAHANAAIACGQGQKIETVFLLCQPHLSFVSSSLVREVFKAGKDISLWTDPAVSSMMRSIRATQEHMAN